MRSGYERFPTRCSHPYCSDCRKKRGRNYGNRRIRSAVRRALRKGGASVDGN